MLNMDINGILMQNTFQNICIIILSMIDLLHNYKPKK